MSIFGDIERLITEHGSAAILRERLALAEQQYKTLERKVVELENQNAVLQAKYEECEKQRKTLEDKLAQQTPPPPPNVNRGPGTWVKARRGG